jgi:cell division protease FtsH
MTRISTKNYNPFSKKYFEEIQRKKNNTINNVYNNIIKKYPITRPDFVEKMHRLNSKNSTVRDYEILGLNEGDDEDDDEDERTIKELDSEDPPQIRIILGKPNNFLKSLGIKINDEEEDDEVNGPFEEDEQTHRRRYVERENTKSKNFQVIKNYNIKFKDVGGYENVKEELRQCIDILKNYNKYLNYNIRIPKGLILEGPPGTGKTLISKALAGEAGCGFIAVSGSDFQEKYVGVGSTRVKELFELAKKNKPCIIFIDEIDALGRKRSADGESSSNERDSTLNSILVELDGFKNNTGIFLVAATNRVDLLDSALIRPGRIDKKIYIGLPDSATRKAIIDIHINGKPYTDTIGVEELVEITEGYSGAQIENLLNEAMLNALRLNKTEFCFTDFDFVMNKMMAGWQPNEHEFTSDIIDHIAIHEMGHAVVGLFSKHHSKVSKVVLNLSSPKSPGYTVFEGSTSNIYIREALFEHLMILLAGRIAEEAFYDVSVTTGAINDFEEALKLSEKMIIYYGMGSNVIYPSLSEKYKELIDIEVIKLINDAYRAAQIIIENSKDLIYETSELLKKDKFLKADMLNEIIEAKYSHIKNIFL